LVVMGLLSGWVNPANVEHLLSPHSADLLQGGVLGDSDKEGVNHGVRVSLTALACEAAVEESGVDQKLPYGWVTPEVGNLLRPDLDLEIVVVASKHRGGRVHD